MLLVAHLVRSLGTGAAAAAAFAAAPAPLVYVLAALGSIVYTTIPPWQAALIPSLVREPREVTASNLASSTIEGLGTLTGPASVALLLGVGSFGVAFSFSAILLAAAAALVAGITPDERRAVRARFDGAGFFRRSLAGFRMIGLEGNVRLIITLLGAQTLVRGALNVLIVVSALELLDLGDSGVGILTAAIGVGGMLGAVGALQLARGTASRARSGSASRCGASPLRSSASGRRR
jgi:hypothetical protein